jgi:hypothetical protein
MRTRGAAAVLLGAAAVLTACGGGSRLTRAEFAHEASEICSSSNRHVSTRSVPSFTEPRFAAKVLAKLAEHDRRTVDALLELKGPKRDVATTEAWIGILDQVVDELDFALAALRHGDESTAREAATRAEMLDERGRELGRAFDVAPCRLTSALPGA